MSTERAIGLAIGVVLLLILLWVFLRLVDDEDGDLDSSRAPAAEVAYGRGWDRDG